MCLLQAWATGKARAYVLIRVSQNGTGAHQLSLAFAVGPWNDAGCSAAAAAAIARAAAAGSAVSFLC